jgi:hypothetical protein
MKQENNLIIFVILERVHVSQRRDEMFPGELFILIAS